MKRLLFPLLVLVALSLPARAVTTFTIFPTNSAFGFVRGTSEASTPIEAWRSNSFTAASFVQSLSPFWYGDVLAGGTQLTDMQNSYTCIFLRRQFVLTNLAEIATLRLGALVDDGFIVWVNGVEVARVNMVDATPNNPVTIASLANNYTEPVPFLYYDFPYPPSYLLAGTNLLAIQVFNTSLSSSDLGFNCELLAVFVETNPPTVVSVGPMPGASMTSLTQVTVTFSEPVQGVTADDLVVNGLAATGVSGSGDTYTFTFPQPAYGGVPIAFGTNSGIGDLALPPNPFDANSPGATWTYTLLDIVPPTVAGIFPQPGATVRSLGEIEVTFSEDVAGVNAADLLINGQPATNVMARPAAKFVFQFPAPTPGPVAVSWSASHGIGDLAVPPNAFVSNAWSYVYDPNASVGHLVINEILAAVAGTNGLRDPSATPEDPDPLPWIELYNQGTGAIDLAGWSLSDDPDVPGQWIFPSKLIQPGEYLIVFASGLDIRNPAGTNRFHTNFKLGRGGEFLGLYSPDSPRALVSAFAPEFPEQRNDTSYGYDTQGQLRYFSTPTPGAANGNSTITGVVAPVHFSVARGHYSQPFNLALSCPTPGAIIRYTTDGREPTETIGTRYLAPLRLTNTTLLRVAAFRANLLSSRVGTHSYLFNVSAVLRSLPIISLVTATNNLTGPNGIYGISNVVVQGDGTFLPQVVGGVTNGYHNPSKHGLAWEKPTSVELILPADNSGFQVDAGIRLQGSDYQRPRIQVNDKMSFRLYFRSDYGSGRLDYPLFPLTQAHDFDQIVLRAGFNENNNPFIRDEIIRRLSHDMGDVASHGTVLNLCINGQFMTATRNAGNSPFYNPCERVHEEFLQSYLGGGEEGDVVGPTFAQGAGAPGVIDGDRANFASMHNYINTQPTTNAAVYLEAGRRLDLVNFADYCLLNAYTAMGDWPQNNWRAGRERGNTNALWRFIVWDAEWGMGIYDRNVNSNAFQAFGPGPNGGGLASTSDSEIARIYQRLLLNREFRLLWADRTQKHFFNGGALTPANISNRFEQLRLQMIGVIPSMDTEIPAWARDRWPVFIGQLNTNGLYGFSNSAYGVYASSNTPAFNQFGGRVAPGFNLTMTAPLAGSAIYYTTNGADPRVMFTGAVSNAALAYSGPITLNQSLLIRARALFNGSNWSALNEATFQVASRGVPLRITEIMYNPVGGSIFEYLELQNGGGAAIDLGGMTFEGVTYTFLDGASLAAGARLVLGSDLDPTQFAARYPGVVVFGRFGGSLNNGGEKLTLKDRAGNIIVSVDYDDENGWPTAADGAGYSLEMISPFGDSDAPANWQASAGSDGTPGAANSAPPATSVLLNEVMADNLTAVNHGGTYPDWVELYNPGGAAVNLGGWSLTDDGDPRKFVFAPDTMLDAGNYLVVWCDSVTNVTPGLHSGFALGRNGDSVFLYDSQTNRRDAITFGLQLPDYSVGRSGAGVPPAWSLCTPTTNAPNVAVTLGAATNLALNEWMANPLAGQDDYLELFNRSATDPVALRGTYLGTSNALHQITSLSFVAPRGYALLHADENVGADHLDFKLPSGPNAIILYDDTGAEVQRVNHALQTLGVSQGRLPDGTNNVVNFPGSSSPGAANYTNTYTGPVLNEVLARNQSATNADFVELFNPHGTNFPLAGMSLSVDELQPGQWSFPPTASIPPASHLIIWCDGSRAASTNGGDYNTGRSLAGESGGVYLFNAAGQVVNAIEYGFQVADLSIGLSGGPWRLLSSPTPGAGNSAIAVLGASAALRLNEWMAGPASGADWFELCNTTNRPVDLGNLFLTDDPSTAGQTKFRVPALSFIGAAGFVQWIADSDAGQGRHHVNFDLDQQGESLHLLSASTNFIDSVAFGAQLLGVSEGRLPDGAAGTAPFPGSATPAESNYRLADNVVINELLSHTDPPLEDAVELYNPTDEAAAIGGWYLSNTQLDFKKYRVPDGASIPPRGYLVVYENAFNTGGPTSFTFNAAHGDEVWLSAADAGGNLTGARAGAKFGAAFNGVSFGRHVTSVGVEFVAMSGRSFGVDSPATVAQFRTGTGAANPGPQVGAVVISEIMYHPPDAPSGEPDGEYVELHNLSGSAVQLFDPAHTANTWRLADGISFTFPIGVTLPGGSNLLVVNFDPANATDQAAFRARYGIGASVPLYGPYAGRLDNGGDDVELRAPDAPQPPGASDASFVPYVLMDRVKFGDSAPWPGGAVDGGGLSLQRRPPVLYGNDPVNWVAASPTPGAASGPAIVPPPTITQSPQSQAIFQEGTASFQVAANGAGPLRFQWRFNGIELPDATNSSLVLSYLQLENTGVYDAFVSNPGGTAFSAPATLTVNAPPTITQGPIDQSPLGETNVNVTLSVLATGTPPLRYQWRHNGLPIFGATSPTLLLTNVGLPQTGTYTVSVTNAFGATNASAFVNVLVRPRVLSPASPLNLTAVAGETVTFSITVTGTLPMGYRWRRTGTVTNFVLNSSTCFLTLTNVQPTYAGLYTVIMTNAAFVSPGIITTNAVLTVLADADGDRLPDSWETNNMTNPNVNDANDDPDLDGLTNYEEYLAGTNPQDPSSNLRVGLEVSGGVTVRFTARANKTYTVLFKDCLSDCVWQRLADVIAQAADHLEIVPDPIGSPARYYRLVTPRQP